MKQAMDEQAAKRKPPSRTRQITESAVGIGIIALAGFLKWKGLFASDAYFALLVLFGGALLSKSLVMDFLGAVVDKFK